MLVRPFRPDDLPVLARLARERLVIGIAPWRDPDRWAATAEQWVQGQSGARRALLVAEEGGACAGFVDVSARTHFTGTEEAYVGELVVAESHEGRGAGTALMAAAEGWAREQGLGLIVLDTGTRNERARRFYARLGYAEESVMLAKVLD